MQMTTSHWQRIRTAAAFWLLATLACAASAADVVGAVILAKGVVTASGPETPARTLAKGSEVHHGETIVTASDSFVVVKMRDDSKVTLRPRSEVTLEAYSEEPGKEEALFNLVKGGLRALSGSIGKKRPESYRVETSIATIGIRGTDFLVRLCEDDCRLEELQYGDKPRQPGGGGDGGSKRKRVLKLGDDNDTSNTGFIECRPVSEIKRGLYTAVLDGAIYVLRGLERVELEAVEALLVEDREIICLGDIPHFILDDDYLSENPEETVTLFNLLRNIDEDRQQCAIPEA